MQGVKVFKFLVLVGALLCIEPAMAEVVSDEWAQKRQGDLSHAHQTLPETQPADFEGASEDEINQRLEELSRRVPVLSRHQTITYKPTNENNLDKKFWFEEIEGDHTVYWQFIEVYGTVKESIANLAKRLKNYMSKHRIQKLIITKSPRRPGAESGQARLSAELPFFVQDSID